MGTTLSNWTLCAVLGWCLLAGASFADVTLSITISGSADELIPLLEKLKDLGIGESAASSEIETEESIQVELHSVSSGEPSVLDREEVEEELGLWGAAIQPSPAKPGDTVTVTLQVADTARRIDTIAVAVSGGDGMLFDLYDNGAHGDETARDGVWSYAFEVPQSIDVDEYSLTIIPYDRRGDEVVAQGADEEKIPLRSELTLPVQR